jgi:hypothetical protein
MKTTDTMRFFCLILFLGTALCHAADDRAREIVFNDIESVPRRPLEVAEKSGSVLIFYWHDCPISNGYAPELNRIFAGNTNFAFYIVQVDPDLTVAAAKQHAREYDLRAPVLLDPDHRLVKVAKAMVTPEAVVFGKNGKILYRGRIDDIYAAPGKKRGVTTRHDLQDALDSIAAGKRVKKPETKAIGCLIE